MQKTKGSLKELSPYGDLGVRDNKPMHNAFPHPIKNSGKEIVASQYLRPRAPAVAKDENAGHSYQVVNVPSLGAMKANTTPSKFAATVSRSNGGAAGVETKSWNSATHLAVHKNMRMSNLEGTPGPSARTSKWAATVRTAPGKQITTREETFSGGVLKNKKVKNI